MAAEAAGPTEPTMEDAANAGDSGVFPGRDLTGIPQTRSLSCRPDDEDEREHTGGPPVFVDDRRRSTAALTDDTVAQEAPGAPPKRPCWARVRAWCTGSYASEEKKEEYDEISRMMQNWWHMLNRRNTMKGHEGADGELVICRREVPTPVPGLRVCMTPPGWNNSETAWGDVVACYVRMQWDDAKEDDPVDEMFVGMEWWDDPDSRVRRTDTVNDRAGPSGLPPPRPVCGLRVCMITEQGVKRRGQVDAVEVEMQWDEQMEGRPHVPEIVQLYWWENFAFDQFDSKLTQADHSGALTEYALQTERGSMKWTHRFHWLQKRLAWVLPKEEENSLTDFYLRKCSQLYEGPDYAEGGDRPLGGEKIPHTGVVASDASCLALDTFGHNVDAATRVRLFRRRIRQIRLGQVTVESDSDSDAPDENEQLFALGPTRDRLEWATRRLLQLRLAIEQDDLYNQRFGVLVTSAAQFVLSLLIFALGSHELEGGRFVVLIATFIAGIVGVLAAFIGAFASFPRMPNEKMMSLFHSMQIWMISLLTTFMFVEIRRFYDNERQCNPSQATFVQADACDDRSGIAATLMVGGALFCIVFVGCHEAGDCLDTINDAGQAHDRALLFRYQLALLRELQAPLLHRRPLISEKTGGPVVEEGWSMEWNWRLELPDAGSTGAISQAVAGGRAPPATTSRSNDGRLRRGEPTPANVRRASRASQARRQSLSERRLSRATERSVSSYGDERQALTTPDFSPSGDPAILR
eukprot:TRINITY_DN28324_c0_g1_i1.p1 TRINITY_DN28324_c0_g1~~TRINITY_DN28324_c0_g1_i1.p1  ORF type:complete len:749 (+),score=213.29 TRINITY_DN28324_c0_g1_i1:196-2442(+)